MRGLFILVLIGALLCSMLDGANAKSLRLNVTEATADCPGGGSKSCDFMDPKYWEEKSSPVDGDEVLISDAAVALELTTPLRLASLMMTVSASNSYGTTLAVNSTLTLDAFNSAGFVSISNGFLTVEASIGDPGSVQYYFSGNVTFMDFNAEHLYLGAGSFSAGNLNIRKGLSMNANSVLRCTSVATQVFVTGEVFCNSINVTGSDAINPMAYFFRPVVADTIYIGGSVHLVAILSSVQVNSFKIDGMVELLVTDGSLVSTTPLLLSDTVARMRLSGGIVAPRILFSNILSTTIDNLTIQGDASFSTVLMELNGNMLVKGNVSIAGSALDLLIHYVKGQQPDTIDHPVIDIQGHLDQAQITLRFELDYFANPPQNSSTLIRYFSGNTANFVLNGPELTSFDVSSTSIGFKWAWPQSPSVNSPSGSGNNLGSELSKLDIGLIVACVILVVVVIALIIVLVKKRSPRYEQIRN